MDCAVSLDPREGCRLDARGVAYLIAAARSYEDRRDLRDLETLDGEFEALSSDEVNALVGQLEDMTSDR